MRKLKQKVFLIMALALLVVARAGHSLPALRQWEPVPVERLVENVSRHIKKHPNNAAGYYMLARIHSIAFVKNKVSGAGASKIKVIRGASAPIEEQIGTPHPPKTITVTGEDGNSYDPNSAQLPGDLQEWHLSKRQVHNQPVTREELVHLRESVRNYARATALAPKEASYWLGYGWMLEHGAPYAIKIGVPWQPASKATGKTSRWLNEALTAYRRAYDLEIGAALRAQSRLWLASEAGESLLRVYKLRNTNPTKGENAEVKRVKTALAQIAKKPYIVSPIILPLGRHRALSNLLAPRKSVTFDLMGDESARRWPWVGPDTGILVWDPQRSGKIRSGRQLFGSITWWIFWKNGYEPLAALDDNGDGQLTARELDGISIWRDANGNGVSDAGEVMPVEHWNIVSIATRATTKIGSAPANQRGARLRDGTALPTYDWMPQSLP